MPMYFPAHGIYQERSKNFLWFDLQPKKIKYSGPVETGGQVGISTENIGTKMRFLAPAEFQDTINHNWEPLENILSRIYDKAAGIQRELKLSTQQHKVDTALLYQDSNRREISFTVYLGAYESPSNEILKPIDLLRKHSSPSLHGVGSWKTKVGHPDVFKLDTVLGSGKIVPLINIKNAALTAVQPSYSGPCIEGIPTKCELTLTFKDLEPLSKGSFGEKSGARGGFSSGGTSRVTTG